jgi:hypothetical protein
LRQCGFFDVPSVHKLSDEPNQKRLLKQRDGCETPSGDGAPVPYIVKHVYELRVPTKPLKSYRRNGKPGRKKNRGGWPSSNYITWDERRTAIHEMHIIEKAGYPFRVFLSIRPSPSLADIDAKRRVQQVQSRIGQALKRREQPYVALNVFEKKRGGSLHGHSRLHTDHDNIEVIEKLADWCDWRDGKKPVGSHVEIHARFSVDTDAGYITKEHRWPGPDAVKRRYWQPSEAIPGKRISWTKAARTIIRQTEAPPEFSLAHTRGENPEYPSSIKKADHPEFIEAATRGCEPEAKPEFSDTVSREADPEFLEAVSREAPVSLFHELPTMAAPAKPIEPRKRPKIAERRNGWMTLPMDYPPTAIELLPRVGGSTYAELGARLGLSRQQMNNAAVGRFGLGHDAVKLIPELASA